MNKRIAIIAAVVLMIGFTASRAYVGMPPHAKPGDVGLNVITLLPNDGTISAREPLIVRLQLTNLRKKNLSIGVGGGLNTRVVLYNKSCKLVGATPIEPVSMDYLVSSFPLAPGEKRFRWVVLSALHQFNKPGEYTVRMQMLEPDAGRGVLAEAEMPVRVLPYNAARLQARCKEIFHPLRSLPQNLKSFPIQTRLQALYSVKDNAVLPYLSLIAREWDGSSEQWPAMMCIRELKTAQSKTLFKTLTARRDHAGKVARNVEKAPPVRHVREWFVGDEWSR